jgi:hypothetical protein
VGSVRLTSYRHLSGVVKNEWNRTFAELYSVMAWAGEIFNLMDAKEIRLEDLGMNRIHLASDVHSCCEHGHEHDEVLTMLALCRRVSRAVRVK